MIIPSNEGVNISLKIKTVFGFWKNKLIKWVKEFLDALQKFLFEWSINWKLKLIFGLSILSFLWYL